MQTVFRKIGEEISVSTNSRFLRKCLYVTWATMTSVLLALIVISDVNLVL